MNADELIPIETVIDATTASRCREYVLVLEAAGIDFAVRRVEAGFAIDVPGNVAARARQELEAYETERASAGPAPRPEKDHTGAWIGVVGYAGVLALVALLADKGAFSTDWFAAGRTDGALIRQGQWWRAMTALTLHSGGPHLGGNLIIGGLVGLFAGRMIGSGLAWLFILLAGTLGNLLNAFARQPSHMSIGASTAVFGALGLMAAVALRGRTQSNTSVLTRFAPIIGATILLSLLGTGGSGRTDVGAHVCGFASGIVLGLIHGRTARFLTSGPRGQVAFGLFCLGALTFVWVLALTNSTTQ